MGRNYARKLRERGRVVIGYGRSRGCRTWYAWQEMSLESQRRFCAKHGLSEPDPRAPKIYGELGEAQAARVFGILWKALTNAQRKSFCRRAGLEPVPPPPPVHPPVEERPKVVAGVL
jgi:hypothetical protein